MYTSALLWIIGWPLVIASFLSALLTFGFVFPVIIRRIRVEEEALVQAYGEEYLRYQASTARLVPLIY